MTARNRRKRALIAVPAILAALAGPAVAQARVSALGFGAARTAALTAMPDYRWHMPGGLYPDSVRTTSCGRTGSYEIDCQVEADGHQYVRTYDSCKTLLSDGDCLSGWDVSTQSTWCMVTIDVFKATRLSLWHGRGEVYTRREPDMSCSGN